MEFLNKKVVLCISPHPDDTEYSMMGTIAQFTDTKFICLNLAIGGHLDDTTSIKRIEEVDNVWKEMNCNNVENVYIDEAQYMEDLKEEEWINLIEKQMVKYNVDAIVLPSECDSHFEHRYVSGFGKALIRSKPASLIQYKTPSTDQEWIPNLFVDIRDVYDKKVSALRNFTSQTDRYYFRNNVLMAFHTDFQCAKKGIPMVEQFKVVDLYA